MNERKSRENLSLSLSLKIYYIILRRTSQEELARRTAPTLNVDIQLMSDTFLKELSLTGPTSTVAEGTTAAAGERKSQRGGFRGW